MRASHHIRRQVRRQHLKQYGVAALVTFIALLGEIALRPTSYALPDMVFTLGIAVVTWYAGRRAGLLALVTTAVLSNTVFLDPFGLRSQAVSTVFFLVIGAAIVYAISFGEHAAKRLALERDRLELIANAGAEIDRSLDYQTTLAAVTRMVVPQVADWCVIHLVEAGVHERVAVAHPDPKAIERANRLWDSLPFDPDAARGIPLVLRTGEPELVSEIRGDRIAQDFPDPQ